MAGRERDLAGALRLWGKTRDLKQQVSDSRVLVVGAGGIGCELLKILVLSGFRKIEIVDLDTIDVSNLNRQFLFRREHVGESKAAVAAKAVLRFNQDVEVKAHHGNIKEKQFGVSYMKGFDLVFNALDNVEARRHVNRICIASEVPLVDGGTTGYLGQVTTIIKDKTACYDCQPKAAPKGFPVCTIRSTPDKPIHCIVWAKHLFNLLFGVKDDDNAVTEVDTTMDAAALIRKLFVDDINKLVGMEDLWKTRKPPMPLDLDGAFKKALGGGGAARSALNDREVWGLEQQLQVLVGRYTELVGRAQAGALGWDKDDDAAMDFVLCASNLRSNAFAIEMQTSFRCKQMAGNIIPAIATTNAIISGYMVLEAYKVLDQRAGDCKFIYKCKSEPSGKKVRKLLIPDGLDDPNPHCAICSGQGTAYLKINTDKTSLDLLLRRVLRQELGLNEPCLDTGENMIECLNAFEDEEEQRHFAQTVTQKMSHPSVGFVDGTIVDIVDDSQGEVKIKLHITHCEEMDPEQENFFELSRSAVPVARAAGGDATSAAGAASSAQQAACDDEDDDCVAIIEDETRTSEPSGKRQREEDEAGPKKKRK